MVEPLPWQLHSLAADGRTVTVHYVGSADAAFERLDVVEDDDRVVITVQEREPIGGMTSMAAFRDASVTLDRPLDRRPVIDGTTDTARARR